jgi:hypothetical protein
MVGPVAWAAGFAELPSVYSAIRCGRQPRRHGGRRWGSNAKAGVSGAVPQHGPPPSFARTNSQEANGQTNLPHLRAWCAPAAMGPAWRNLPPCRASAAKDFSRPTFWKPCNMCNRSRRRQRLLEDGPQTLGLPTTRPDVRADGRYEILEWLLLHVPEVDLPEEFRPSRVQFAAQSHDPARRAVASADWSRGSALSPVSDGVRGRPLWRGATWRRA